MYGVRFLVTFLLCVSAAAALAQDANPMGGPIGARYATDAYPGFDPEKIEEASRKEPRWFHFLLGPDRDDAASQLEYCRSLEAAGDTSKAARQLDALVREWPVSREAPLAQLRLAEIREKVQDDLEEAFAEYKYLLDYYPSSCDYGNVARRLFSVAEKMRQEGKTIVFFRFRNTIDVRHAFEAAVLRAPGADWAPRAMTLVAELREEEGKDEEAVKVYENLRSIHRGTPEAAASILPEARARMRILEKKGYNRERCLDTVSYLESSLKVCAPAETAELSRYLASAKALVVEEAYQAALFYDSRMRTKRTAIGAYEKFLAEHPDSPRAEAARARLNELKGAER